MKCGYDGATMNPTIETANIFLVAANGESIVMMNPPRRPMSKSEAMNLAAWLAVMAGSSEDFDKMRDEILAH
jgi:hypothetical protein